MKNWTKQLAVAAIAAVAILGLASQAKAATVTWSTPATIARSGEVSTSGTQVFGWCPGLAYGNSAAVVNGVDFGYNNPNWTVTYSESMGSLTQFNPSVPTLSGSDASDYQSVLSLARETNTGSGSFTFGNLTLGQTYQLQFWVADYRAYSNNRTETLTATGDSASPALTYLNSGGSIHGQYILGTFTADASSITFTMTANEDAMYNAMQLRAIPEPSTLTLVGFGLLGAVAMGRRFRRTA